MLISLSSQFPRSGKDHTAEQLAALISDGYGFDIELLSFAAPLKEAMENHFPNNFLQCLNENKDMLSLSLAAVNCEPSTYKNWLVATYEGDYNLARSARWHLQQFGTNYTRNHLDLPNHWLGELHDKMADPNKVYIITDTRFPNELEFSRSLGYVFNIVPIGFPNSHPVNIHAAEYSSQSATEGLLVDATFDAHINNIWGDPLAAAKEIVEFIKHNPRT